MAHRDGEHRWSRRQAAERAGIDGGAVKRIERGENYTIISLEQYAIALGRPLEDWLREIINVPSAGGHLQATADNFQRGERPAVKTRRPASK